MSISFNPHRDGIVLTFGGEREDIQEEKTSPKLIHLTGAERPDLVPKTITLDPLPLLPSYVPTQHGCPVSVARVTFSA